ncbi:MAG: helix-turn-helix transcriptional regulator [Deltaproteobacteria bacterium]|nr:helix-turn-helix transcriptional regulator [Deltaproteobacteria bacterium]
MKPKNSNDFIPAKPHAKLKTGEVIKILRELKGWTQKDLAKRSGINTTNISLLENKKVEIGKKRAEQLARAFKVHPAIIMFPEYEAEAIRNVA